MPKKHPVRRYIVPILILMISILFFMIMIKNKPAPLQKDTPERAWSVESLIVKKSSHKPVLQLYGQVITTMDIQLTASIEADVIKRHVNLGDTVRAGQRLLSLDKSRLEQIRLQRRAELIEAQISVKNEQHLFKTDGQLLKQETSLLEISNNALKRAKTLEKSSMASNSQLDDARRTEIQQKLAITRLKANLANHPARLTQLKAKQQQAQSRLTLAEDDLEHTQIFSPIEGVITAVSVDNAEHVRQGTALFSISDTKNIEVQSLIPQTQYALLNHALSESKATETGTVKANILAGNNLSLPAVLNRLPANINKRQAGSLAFFRLNSPERHLLIGQTVTINTELNPQADSIAIPHDAIYGTNTVFIVKDQRLKRMTVNWLGETFIDNQKYSLIGSNNIHNGDEILVSKFANAMHNLKVKTRIRTQLNAQETALEK